MGGRAGEWVDGVDVNNGMDGWDGWMDGIWHSRITKQNGFLYHQQEGERDQLMGVQSSLSQNAPRIIQVTSRCHS